MNDEDVDLEHPFTCDPTRLDPSIDAPATSPVERACALGRVYLIEDERQRRSLGLPPVKHPARLPGPPPTEPSYRAEAEHAAMLGGRVITKLLAGVHVPPVAPAPGPKPGGPLNASGSPFELLRRAWRRLRGVS